jgi:hypothetical protein
MPPLSLPQTRHPVSPQDFRATLQRRLLGSTVPT